MDHPGLYPKGKHRHPKDWPSVGAMEGLVCHHWYITPVKYLVSRCPPWFLYRERHRDTNHGFQAFPWSLQLLPILPLRSIPQNEEGVWNCRLWSIYKDLVGLWSGDTDMQAPCNLMGLPGSCHKKKVTTDQALRQPRGQYMVGSSHWTCLMW